LRPLQALPAAPNLVEAGDDREFFAGTTGKFGPFRDVQEATLGTEPVASAITEEPQTGRPVIAVSRLGKGYVYRFPLPELPGMLVSGNVQLNALMQRTWTLLSH
jgi:hypothetical protein